MRGPMRMVMAPFQLKLLTLSNQQEGLGSSREKHSLPPMGCGAPFQPSGGTRTVTHPCLMCFSHPVLAGFIVNTRGNNPAHPTQNSHQFLELRRTLWSGLAHHRGDGVCKWNTLKLFTYKKAFLRRIRPGRSTVGISFIFSTLLSWATSVRTIFLFFFYHQEVGSAVDL